MSEPDKYWLKARQIGRDYEFATGRAVRHRLEDAIAEALAEAAREALERAAELAEGYRYEVDNTVCIADKIAEAIRKELP